MPRTKQIQDALRKCELSVLVRGIRHDDPKIRLEIAQTLERFYDEPEAIQALGDMLLDPDQKVITAVLKALTTAVEHGEYCPAYAHLLEAEEKQVRVALELKDTEEHLVRLTNSPLPPELKDNAMEILSFLEPEDFFAKGE